jgi:L-seryl-tRNA(Ser) seleniumtransferase
MRALRAGKLTYAALEATLEEIAAGRAASTVPVTRMIALGADDIGSRATALAERLHDAGLGAEVIDGESTIGGGSAPGTMLPTRLVAVSLPADRLDAALRALDPPVVARITDDRVVFDLRTVEPDRDGELAELIARAAAASEATEIPGRL